MKKTLLVLSTLLFLAISMSFAAPKSEAVIDNNENTEVKADSSATTVASADMGVGSDMRDDSVSHGRRDRTKHEGIESGGEKSNALPLIALILSIVSIAASAYLFISYKKVSYLEEKVKHNKESFENYKSTIESKINTLNSNARSSKTTSCDDKITELEAKIKSLEEKLATPAPAPAPVAEAVPEVQPYVPVTYYSIYDATINGVEVEKLKSAKSDSSVLKIVTKSDSLADVTIVEGLGVTQLARLFDSSCTNVDGNTQKFTKVEVIKKGVMSLDNDEWIFTEPIRIKLS